ncbi:Asp-tRNA(Asn)/Glu-tRNA(Gln) amidotransferase subunit GatB [Heliophilum fasciatum]|uniref:Aspartyl/glutamyl-tRNA(Asn/Gln) amidotransferase subunit B n=1 Tax=Heliophilum fasciatum TaxID=35700 RepID=A0A4R2RX70_9FIRM|nr:Asp-tRNA(Asn)/Glu-tRNA(Gln) amidotransferase subunit GatB [Heliophilum fasciatum]MCW2277263.1 aspartyl-tRNA(Asn)/glutamyl-tRNA(Gln) amidotransferase subunit B [Heliophilum fasciatum]TCP68103.1 aspartyl/glutamyl-tRNA(Asn/Gln) amidotransferase subunit B [Heliophilum fasciatum]
MQEFEFEIVMGLEIHSELATKSKIFCGCTTEFGGEQNTHVCPVCLGLPGVLPVLNRQVVEYAMTAGLALNCTIAEFSKFDRKNYFYPDLPKAYQTSQYDLPIAEKGWVDITTSQGTKRIGITRVHMEEDAGKLVHGGGTLAGAGYSLADYNRTAVPLIEIVSEPDIRSVEEAIAYMEHVKAILEYTGVSDCKMEQGSLRCDANISLRPWGQKEFGVRSELKNMNSFKTLQKALEYEIERQAEILRDGGVVVQETRMWDDAKGVTISLRSKEEAHDYRYFPEPDLVPIIISREWVDRVRAALPELPEARHERLVAAYGLPSYDAGIITDSKAMADYFDAACRHYGIEPSPIADDDGYRQADQQGKDRAKQISNYMMGELTRLVKEDGKGFEDCPISPENLVGLLQLLEAGTISSKIAKTVFETMYATGKEAKVIVEEKGLVQISDEGAIAKIVAEIVDKNPNVVADYKAGKEKAVGFFVGQIMKATKGKANPGVVNQLLKAELDRR